MISHNWFLDINKSHGFFVFFSELRKLRCPVCRCHSFIIIIFCIRGRFVNGSLSLSWWWRRQTTTMMIYVYIVAFHIVEIKNSQDVWQHCHTLFIYNFYIFVGYIIWVSGIESIYSYRLCVSRYPSITGISVRVLFSSYGLHVSLENFQNYTLQEGPFLGQYSICGKTRRGQQCIFDLFWLFFCGGNTNLGGWEAPEEELTPNPRQIEHWFGVHWESKSFFSIDIVTHCHSKQWAQSREIHVLPDPEILYKQDYRAQVIILIKFISQIPNRIWTSRSSPSTFHHDHSSTSSCINRIQYYNNNSCFGLVQVWIGKYKL